METRTKYYIADGLLGATLVLMLYIAFCVGHMYLDYAMNKGPEDFDEPWIWFGGMAILPLVVVFYATILLKVCAVTFRYASGYHKELTGKEWRTWKTRPMIHDFTVNVTFILFTPYLTQQVYGMMEGSSTLVFAITAMIPALTCVCAMDVYQTSMGWLDRRREGKNAERKEMQRCLKEALEE